MYVNHLYHKYYPNVEEKKIKWHQGPEKDMYVHYFAIVDIHKMRVYIHGIITSSTVFSRFHLK